MLTLVLQFLGFFSAQPPALTPPYCVVGYANEASGLLEVECDFIGPPIAAMRVSRNGKAEAVAMLSDGNGVHKMNVVLKPEREDTFTLDVLENVRDGNEGYRTICAYLPLYHGGNYAGLEIRYRTR